MSAWVLAQGQANALPFAPAVIGSHWSRHVQADVVAVNWRQQAILIGECKWSTDRVDRQIVRELIEGKTPLALRDLPDQGRDWTVTYACFARGGFTDARGSWMCIRASVLIWTCSIVTFHERSNGGYAVLLRAVLRASICAESAALRMLSSL